MTAHVFRMTAATALVVLITPWPFMPGSYDLWFANIPTV